MQKTINIGGKLFDFNQARVMAIVNVTPDSFYSSSRLQSERAIVDRLHEVVRQGADMIDIGGYSTRPNAVDVPVDQEVKRVCEAMVILKREIGDFPVSIDTFRSEVVRTVYDKFGAFVVNDVSGGTLDQAMFDTTSKLKLPYILGHIRGTPATMTQMTDYDDLMKEIADFFVARLCKVRESGMVDVILDPCFGFAKNVQQNFLLLKQLSDFKVFDLPILAGLSRKRMIYGTLGIEAEDALIGTAVLNWQALANGANLLRVHDILEAVQTIKLYSTYVAAK